jgi:anti-sigma regulatory factor (Ser/Thr protein kinase)
MDPLVVPGVLASLSKIAEFIKVVSSEAGLHEKTAYRLRLAVDEIATNIITHGYLEANIEGVLELQATIDEKTLLISIEDTAKAFNPLKHTFPDDLDLPLEERKVGGLGIYLAIQNVDEFRYERVDGRNRNIFVVNRPTVPENECI